MLVIGRITKDAVISTTKDEKQVVHFSIAVNDYYKPKGAAEATKLTTFINCSYWITTKIADWLKKGTLVELTGRISVNAYLDTSGNPKASLNCHVSSIKIHGAPKGAEILETSAGATISSGPDEEPDDLPF